MWGLFGVMFLWISLVAVIYGLMLSSGGDYGAIRSGRADIEAFAQP
jgi:hypothetical protein